MCGLSSSTLFPDLPISKLKTWQTQELNLPQTKVWLQRRCGFDNFHTVFYGQPTEKKVYVKYEHISHLTTSLVIAVWE